MRSLSLKLLVLTAVLMSCRQPANAQIVGYWPHSIYDPSFQDVSIIQLIANPQAWDGKKVRVEGFLRIEFEGDAVYLHREDFDFNIMRNALSIDLPKDMTEKQRRAVDLKYILCEGTFVAGNHGHMGLFSGELTQVQRIQWLGGPRSELPPPPPPPK